MVSKLAIPIKTRFINFQSIFNKFITNQLMYFTNYVIVEFMAKVTSCKLRVKPVLATCNFNKFRLIYIISEH